MSFLKRPSIASAFLCLSMLLAGGVWIQQGVEAGRSTLDQYLKRSGIEIESYQIKPTGFRSFEILDFKINGNIQSHISKLEFLIGLQWHPQPGFYLEEIRILKPSLSLNNKNSTPDKKSSSDQSHHHSLIHQHNNRPRLLDRVLALPTRIVIKDAQLNTNNVNSYPLQAAFDLNIDPPNGNIQLKLRTLHYDRFLLLKEVEGHFILDSLGEHFPFTLASQRHGSHNWQGKGKLQKDFSKLEIYVKNAGIPKEWQTYSSSWIANPDQINYAMNLALDLGSQIDFTYHAASTNGVLSNPKLASSPVGPIPLKVKLRGQLGLATGRLQVEEGIIKLVDKDDKTTSSRLRFSLLAKDLLDPNEELLGKIHLPPSSCPRLISTIPTGLAPKLSNFKGTGIIEALIFFRLDSHSPEKLEVQLQNFKNSCQLTSNSPLFNRQLFLDRPSLEPYFKKPLRPQQKVFSSDSFSRDYSHLLAKAIVLSEDSSFWQHNGVLFPNLLEAMRINYQAGYFKLGASTITMQLVKNLYFNQDKTISRKAQEILISLYLEGILSKQHILDTYLNIIQFGPNLYGISNASKGYFNKTPSQLNLKESVFLAAILPSPDRYFSYVCDSTEGHELETRMNSILTRMHSASLIDEQDLLATQVEQLEFFQGHELIQESCPQVLAKSQQSLKPQRTL